MQANKGDHGDGDEELLSATSMMQKLDFLQRELSSVGMKEELVENDPQKFYHRWPDRYHLLVHVIILTNIIEVLLVPVTHHIR